MIQLCAGLGAAHNASIYHRDIKPGNIFVRSDGILKILDFGVARLASSSMTAAGFIVGTPDYMSPEQARGADIDGRSDIFSLGGVFYFMLTGRKPFPASDLPTLFHQIQSDDPPPPLGAEAPPELAAVVMKALSKKRETRYQTCQELLARSERREAAYPLEADGRRLTGQIGRRRGQRPRRMSAGRGGGLPPPSDSAASATDDTVDFLPVSSFDSDDTVTLERASHLGEAHHGSNRFSDFRRVRTAGATVHTGPRPDQPGCARGRSAQARHFPGRRRRERDPSRGTAPSVSAGTLATTSSSMTRACPDSTRKFAPEGDSYVIVDLKSRNGVWMNGQPDQGEGRARARRAGDARRIRAGARRRRADGGIR